MRKLLLLVVFALVAAACGGAADPVATSSTPDESAVAETSPGSATDQDAGASGDVTTGDLAPEGEESDSTPDSTQAASSFDGPPAPDFELALDDGSTFKLSDEQKPVYVVFWAEW